MAAAGMMLSLLKNRSSGEASGRRSDIVDVSHTSSTCSDVFEGVSGSDSSQSPKDVCMTTQDVICLE